MYVKNQKENRMVSAAIVTLYSIHPYLATDRGHSHK